MAELKTESHNARRNVEAAGRVCDVMTGKGYTSVFEHIAPTLDSQNVYTLWTNLSEGGFEMMTVVDHRGGVGYYRMMPALGFAKRVREEAEGR